MRPDAVCVYCRTHPVDALWRPFCSERCKLLDLGHWLDGTYNVPGGPVEPPDPKRDDDRDQSG
jgi:endogenous inhibitor of DNA gyrase (YacG/DUF329 family)